MFHRLFHYSVPHALTLTTSRRLNLLIHNIQKAASSPSPAALCDAAAAVHYARYFKFSKEKLRELQQRLHGLVREANQLIETAFPVTVVRERSKGVLQPGQDSTYVEFTTTRAQFDAHEYGYFTYLKLPDMIPWNPENDHGASETMPSLNITSVSPECVATLKAHYGLSK